MGRLCTFITFSDGLRTMRTAIRYKSYGKRDYINLPIANFPLICSNIVAYGVCVSQLLRYSSYDTVACVFILYFLIGRLILTNKLHCTQTGIFILRLKFVYSCHLLLVMRSIYSHVIKIT